MLGFRVQGSGLVYLSVPSSFLPVRISVSVSVSVRGRVRVWVPVDDEGVEDPHL